MGALNIPAKYIRRAETALLVAAGIYVYAPSLYGGWLWDDFEIRENLQLRTWSGLLKMWYAPATPDYAPIRTLLYWIEWHFWGDGLFGFHLTSIALHICAAWLLWRVLDMLVARDAPNVNLSRSAGVAVDAVSRPRSSPVSAVASAVAETAAAFFRVQRKRDGLSPPDGRASAGPPGHADAWRTQSAEPTARTSREQGGTRLEGASTAEESAGWIAAMLFIVHPMAVESVAWLSEIKNTFSLALLLGAFWCWIEYDEIFTGRSGRSGRIPSKPFLQEGREDREGRHSGGLFIPDPAIETTAVLPDLPDLPVKKTTAPQLLPHLPDLPVKKWYFVSLLLFVLAMLVKASVVMFPLGLLLYAWWRRGRVRWRDVLASLPFFAVSAALGAVTILFQMSRAIAHWNLPKLDLPARIAQAGLAIVFYFGKCLVPVDMMPIYPAWRLQPLSVVQFWPWVVIGGVVILLVALRRRAGSIGGAAHLETLMTQSTLASEQTSSGKSLRSDDRESAGGALSVSRRFAPPIRHLIFGLGWFVLFLLPVIGFIPMAYQHVAPVADHLCYLSLAAFVCLAAVGISSLSWEGGAARLETLTTLPALGSEQASLGEGASSALSVSGRFAPPQFTRYLIFGLTCILVLVLAHASRRYANVFADQETLWTYNLAHNSTSPAVYVNLGFIEHHDGLNDAAIANYKKAIQLDPDDAQAEDELASIYIDENDPQEALAHYRQAIVHYERALALDPTLIATRRSLGKTLAEAGQTEQAIAQYKRILRENPDDAQTETNYGKALGDEGRIPEAMAHFEKALELDPDSYEAENSLGMAYMAQGHPEEAKRHVEQALRLNGDFAEAENNLGFILASQGLQGAAIPHFEDALRLKPSLGQAENNLGFALARMGRMPEAITHLQRAVNLAPADPKARYNLAMVLAATGRREPAIAELKAALALDPNFARAKELLRRLGSP